MHAVLVPLSMVYMRKSSKALGTAVLVEQGRELNSKALGDGHVPTGTEAAEWGDKTETDRRKPEVAPPRICMIRLIMHV
jgi:hypothetical protein